MTRANQLTKAQLAAFYTRTDAESPEREMPRQTKEKKRALNIRRRIEEIRENMAINKRCYDYD